MAIYRMEGAETGSQPGTSPSLSYVVAKERIAVGMAYCVPELGALDLIRPTRQWVTTSLTDVMHHHGFQTQSSGANPAGRPIEQVYTPLITVSNYIPIDWPIGLARVLTTGLNTVYILVGANSLGYFT